MRYFLAFLGGLLLGALALYYLSPRPDLSKAETENAVLRWEIGRLRADSLLIQGQADSAAAEVRYFSGLADSLEARLRAALVPVGQDEDVSHLTDEALAEAINEEVRVGVRVVCFEEWCRYPRLFVEDHLKASRRARALQMALDAALELDSARVKERDALRAEIAARQALYASVSGMLALERERVAVWEREARKQAREHPLDIRAFALYRPFENGIETGIGARFSALWRVGLEGRAGVIASQEGIQPALGVGVSIDLY